MDQLDDRDEFTKGGMELVVPPPYGPVPEIITKRYPYVIPNTFGQYNLGNNSKNAVEIRCTVPGCEQTRWVFVSDLFQVKICDLHKNEERMRRRAERAEKLKAQQELMGMESSVSDVPVTEELGGIRPAHLLVKAKHDSSWIEYVDDEGNTKFMQVHDVRSARDAYGRWAVYGVDQNGDPVHELYDLRHGFEHSGTFSGIRELQFGEIVKLAQQGVIRGKDGKEIQTLSGLMQIADEPLRVMIMKKAKEAKAGGPPLADIEKQLFAEPTASSAQKRRAGNTGTRPWAQKLMSS